LTWINALIGLEVISKTADSGDGPIYVISVNKNSKGCDLCTHDPICTDVALAVVKIG
jgi:hypothetical protein